MIWQKVKELFMTLFYVDKNNANRLDPSVNAADVHNNPLAHNTTSISPRAEGTQTQAKVTTKDSRIIGFDGTNNIGLFGFDDAGNMVVKVAKTGFDANSATDNNLVFSSARNTLQVIDVLSTTIGSNTIAPGNVTDTATVDISSYSLSATPVIFAFYTTGVETVSLGKTPWGGTVIEFVGGTGTLNAFSLLKTAHTSTSAVFSRKFINNSSGSLTVPQYNIMFMICSQTAS